MDGETLLSLNEQMITELLPVMKFRVKFIKLLSELKQMPLQESSGHVVVPSSSVVAQLVPAHADESGENDENEEDEDPINTRYFLFRYAKCQFTVMLVFMTLQFY